MGILPQNLATFTEEFLHEKGFLHFCAVWLIFPVFIIEERANLKGYNRCLLPLFLRLLLLLSRSGLLF